MQGEVKLHKWLFNRSKKSKGLKRKADLCLEKNCDTSDYFEKKAFRDEISEVQHLKTIHDATEKLSSEIET